MAGNILTTNPLYFDTVGSTSEVARGVWITAIVWDSGSSGAVDDGVVLHDASGGNVVFQAELAVAKDTIIFTPAKAIHAKGLYLTTMGHGTLLVYLA